MSVLGGFEGYYLLYFIYSTEIYKGKNGKLIERLYMSKPGNRKKECLDLLDTLSDNICPVCGKYFQHGCIEKKKKIKKNHSTGIYEQEDKPVSIYTNDQNVTLTHDKPSKCTNFFVLYDVRAKFVYSNQYIDVKEYSTDLYKDMENRIFVPDEFKQAVLSVGKTIEI